MCDITAGLTTALSAGSSILNFGAQKVAAQKQNAYNLQRQAVEEKYRVDMYKHGTEVYNQDIQYGGEVLEYQKKEFDRMGRMLDKARDSLDTNYFRKVGQLLQRQVEEEMALAFGDDAMSKSARDMRGKAVVNANQRGVEGASVDAILDDITRQEGDALTTIDLNRQAGRRQATWDALGLKAENDERIFNLQVQTYNPTAPITAPGPAGSVTPAQQVSGPSSGSLLVGLASNVVSGFNTAQLNKSWDGSLSGLAKAFKI